MPRVLLCRACLDCFTSPDFTADAALEAARVHCLVERHTIAEVEILDVEREARRLLAPLSSRPVETT